MTDILAAATLTCGFMGTFYVWHRPRKHLWTSVTNLRQAALDPEVIYRRDEPRNVMERLVSFGVGTTGAVLVGEALHRSRNDSSGFLTKNLVCEKNATQTSVAISATVLTTMLLLSGSIADRVVFKIVTRADDDDEDNLSWLSFLRNCVVCPIGEEIFFRGLLHTILHARSPTARVLLSSTLFSLSHAHHIFVRAADEYQYMAEQEAHENVDENECTSTNVRECWLGAAAMTGAQCAVTAVFGLVSGSLFESIAQHNVAAVAASHALCNYIGPPSFSFLNTRISPKLRLADGTCHILGIGLFIAVIVAASGDKARTIEDSF